MSELDKTQVVTLQPSPPSVQDATKARGRAFKIHASHQNADVFEAAIDYYRAAKMPLEHIANAGDFLGEEVLRFEKDAPLQDGWQGGSGKRVDGNVITVWQSRGEIIPTDHQIEGPATITGNEVIILRKEVASPTTPQENTIEVVEAVKLVKETQAALEAPQTPDHDSELLNSPFLRPVPADLKKAE